MTVAADEKGTLGKLVHYPAFTRFLSARLLASVAVQMQTVAVGWQIYSITGKPLDLGLIGLSQFLPFVLLVLPAGHIADRYNRVRILAFCIALEFFCALALLVFTHSGLTVPWPVFAVMVVFGVARAFSMPAGQAVTPNLVPPALFARAVAVNSSTWQVSTIVGPAIGGLVYLAGPDIVYATVAALLSAAFFLVYGVKVAQQRRPETPASWHELLEGLRFVWQKKVILGAVSLDLFAVLFGGAVALLPAVASDILHVGPAGFGWLRAAPGIGAACIALMLAWRPITKNVGSKMFAGVAVFGVATVVFGLSHVYLVSLAALVVIGASDMVSVYIRHMLVQLETPDGIRGRVSAVNAVFIGASNELGEFESGVTAAWWGLKPAIVVGGIASVAIAAIWTRAFPKLRSIDVFPEHATRDP